jgi:Cd2+/Zn2+-exporting ATPase
MQDTASPKIILDFSRMPMEAETCTACLDRVQDRLRVLSGVKSVRLLPDSKGVVLEIQDTADAERVRATAEGVLAEVATGFGHELYRVGGMDCPDCASEIEEALKRTEGVLACRVDYASARLSVEYDRTRTDPETLRREIRKLGFSVQPLLEREKESPVREIFFLSLGALFWLGGLIGGHIAGVPEWLPNALFIVAGLVSGWRMLLLGIRSLFRLRFTTNALMTIAVVGAAGLHEFGEAALVIWLFSLGNVLQSQANRRTRSAILALLESAPKSARVRTPEGVREVDVRDVAPGDWVEVLPHTPVPVDGIVVEGETSVNNALLTGESEPQVVGVGSKVLAGAVNEGGFVVIRAEKVFADTAYARTLRLIEQGQTARAPYQETIERFAGWYTPGVIACALVFAVAGPLLHLRTWAEALHQALWLLMVSCPCALVISVPVAVVTAIGSASRFGALVRGGKYLEALSAVPNWIFDKTGTLTHARFEVSSVVALREGYSEDEVLSLAGALAKFSVHPVSRAITRKASPLEGVIVEAVRDFPGKGVQGTLQGKVWRLGSWEFVKEILPTDGKQGKGTLPQGESPPERPTVYLTNEEGLVGKIELDDTPREGAREVVELLQRHGKRVVLLSGDREVTVQRFAREMGVGEAYGQLSPEEKAEFARRLAESGGVVTVGDGVNDVSALQRSTVGIAMGAAGSEAAVECADVVLLSDDISRIRNLFDLSRRLHQIVIENIVFSLATKALLVAVGIASPLPFWLAVAGDMGVSLLVTLNALRLRF